MSQRDRRLGSPNERYPGMILVNKTLLNTSWDNLANFLTLEIGVAAVIHVFHGVAVSDRLDHFWCFAALTGLLAPLGNEHTFTHFLLTYGLSVAICRLFHFTENPVLLMYVRLISPPIYSVLTIAKLCHPHLACQKLSWTRNHLAACGGLQGHIQCKG